MVILGGLEIVAAGYLLKELHGDSKKEEEERERERRRRRRHHSRDEHRPSRHDDSPPARPSRPSQQLMPPQQPNRPYSAPPPQNRPQFATGFAPVAMAATAAAMWPGRPQQGPPPQQGPIQSGTWPQGPPQQQLMQQRPPQQQPQQQAQWQGRPPQNSQPNNFIPPPLQRPQTNPIYPPAGTHIDLKTGKVQHDMFPPEMPRAGEAREYYDAGGVQRQNSYERGRENSAPQPPAQRPAYPPQSYSQPQISVSPPMHHAQTMPIPHPQGYAELDSETPGRYRPQRDEKGGREKSNSFSGRRDYDDDFNMRSPPPAYREWSG